MNSKLKFLSLPIITTIPLFSIVSCSSSESISPTQRLEETIKLQKYIDDKKPTLTGKSIQNDKIKNIISIFTTSNFEKFESEISEYFDLSFEFKNFLKNEGIFSKLKKINISPIEGEKSVYVVFYLNSSSNDSNIVSVKIDNVLANNFAYAKIFEIDVVDKVNYIEGKDAEKIFKDEWDKFWKQKDLTILKRGFTFKNENDFISLLDDFEITYNSYQITISLKQKAINEGKIIKQTNANNPYWTIIRSQRIIK